MSGAVAILAVFAIMMTHNPRNAKPAAYSSHWLTGFAVAVCVFTVLAWAIRSSGASAHVLPAEPDVSVQQIGIALMHHFVLPLELMGLLLTAALIGAVVIAMDRDEEAK